jgi:hypothetical protein
LNETATNEAASEGVSALLENFKGANLGQITALLSGGSDPGEGSGILEGLKSKMTQILAAKGMATDEAEGEAQSTAESLISGLKEKFLSPSEEDKDFDLSNIAGLLGGNSGGLLQKAKSLFR